MSAQVELPIAEPRKLPVWAMGLANMPTGFVFGFISTSMGILLAARHVSVGRVGAISAIAFSPTWWAWALAPVLDVRFTKRVYAHVFAALAAVLLIAAIFSLDNLTALTVLLTASCASVVLFSTSVGGWAPDAVSDAEYDAMSGWLNVANLGAAGVFSSVVILLMRTLPLQLTAILLGLLVMAPTILLRYFPAPRQPEGTLRENFAAMMRSLRRVMREGRIWVGLVIFLVPVGGFALTNLFSTLGGSFNASEKWVTTLNGPCVAVACGLGSLLGISLCRRFRRRNVYLIAGAVAAVVATAMGWLPHTLLVYAVGLLAYNLAQGFNYTAMIALELEIIGPQNALSGTMIAVLTACANVPISTMSFIDSRVFDRHGIDAMFYVDSGSAAVTVVLLWVLVLPLMDRWMLRRGTAALVLE